MGCHFLLQGIFLTQGSNPCLLHLLCWQVGSSPLGSSTTWEALKVYIAQGQNSFNGAVTTTLRYATHKPYFSWVQDPLCWPSQDMLLDSNHPATLCHSSPTGFSSHPRSPKLYSSTAFESSSSQRLPLQDFFSSLPDLSELWLL